MKPIYFDKPTVIDAGGISFGPYGPGPCSAPHPGTGLECFHHAKHMGSHAAVTADTPSGEVKYRW